MRPGFRAPAPAVRQCVAVQQLNRAREPESGGALLGFGRVVALYYCLFTLYQIHQENWYLFSETTARLNPTAAAATIPASIS